MSNLRRITYRDILRDVAVGEYGLVSLRDAETVGVPAVEVRKLAARGALERVGHGLYRDLSVPASTLDQFAWAVRVVGSEAYLMAESVLDLHRLALVNPARISVGTPDRIWRELPPLIHAVTRCLPPSALTVEEGIAQTTLFQAFADCLDTIMSERLREAITEAGRRGLLSRREQNALRARLARRKARGAP